MNEWGFCTGQMASIRETAFWGCFLRIPAVTECNVLLCHEKTPWSIVIIGINGEKDKSTISFSLGSSWHWVFQACGTLIVKELDLKCCRNLVYISPLAAAGLLGSFKPQQAYIVQVIWPLYIRDRYQTYNLQPLILKCLYWKSQVSLELKRTASRLLVRKPSLLRDDSFH